MKSNQPWLLDQNVQSAVGRLLRSKGIESVTANKRGWSEHSNGDLVAAAAEAGIEVIVTRDTRFRESASRTLRKYQNVCIVLIVIPPSVKKQALTDYLLALWNEGAIVPESGQLIVWGRQQ